MRTLARVTTVVLLMLVMLHPMEDTNAADPVTPPVPSDADQLKALQHASQWLGDWTRTEGGKMFTTYEIKVRNLGIVKGSRVLGGRLKVTSYYEEQDHEMSCMGIPRYKDGVHTLALFEMNGRASPRSKSKGSKRSKASYSPEPSGPTHCTTMRIYKGQCYMDKFRVACPN